MNKRPELKSLLPRHRKFVELMAYQGLSREDAYIQSHNAIAESLTEEEIASKARALFSAPHILLYYNAIMDEVREREVKKAIWTKERATETLLKLIQRAEEDLYGVVDEDGNTIDKPLQLTMSRLNAIVLPVKELNLMNGFNQTNVNMEGCVVKIVGEEDIPD